MFNRVDQLSGRAAQRKEDFTVFWWMLQWELQGDNLEIIWWPLYRVDSGSCTGVDWLTGEKTMMLTSKVT